jgi:hypothetical protein
MAKLYKNLTIAARMEMFVTKEMGFVAIPSRNKYKMFERVISKVKDGMPMTYTQYLFLGKNGAVRTTTNIKNAAKSISMTDAYMAALITYETKNNLMETK